MYIEGSPSESKHVRPAASISVHLRKAHKLRSDIKRARTRLSASAEDLIWNIEFRDRCKEREAKICFILTSALGFSDGASFDEIIASLGQFGFRACSPAVAPELILRHKEALPTAFGASGTLFAMNPLAHADRSSHIFLIIPDEDGNLVLRTVTVKKGDLWSGGEVWAVEEVA